MIVMEILESVGGKWERSKTRPAMIMPRPSSFIAFAAAMSEAAEFVVTEAPELEGKMINPSGGRPCRMFSREEMTSHGADVELTHGLFWIDPIGVNLSPNVYLMPPNQIIRVPVPPTPPDGIGFDWNRPGEVFCNYHPINGSGLHGAPGDAGPNARTPNAQRRGRRN